MGLYLAGLQGKSGWGHYVLEDRLKLLEAKERQGEEPLDLYLAGGVNGNCKPMWTDFITNGRAGGLDVLDVYLAGGQGHHRQDDLLGKYKVGDKIDVMILESYYYADKWTEAIIPKLKKFLLDSGAFTFMSSHKGKVDWDEYLEGYIDFINRNNVDLFFELDIDSLVGYENVLKMRKKLELGTGKKSIPVWHISRGKEEFLKMCDEYDYVAFGGILTDGVSTKKIMEVMPWFVNEAHKRGTKIHGLGFTNLKGIETIKFDSVDSTSWTAGNRFGCVYRFNGRTMEKFDRKSNQRMKNSRELAINNFNEWVKFQKYAETNL